jgi:NitT/TauT family transport system permease protein
MADTPPLARLFVFRGQLAGRVKFLAGTLTALAAIGVWAAAPMLDWIAPVFLPSPWAVLQALWVMVTQNGLMTDAGISIARVWAAFLLSAIMAIPLGILMSSYRIIGAAFEPLIDFVRYLPVPALVPLSIIWFGIGEETKIFLLWLGTFFQLVLLVAEDMKRVPQEYFETSYTVGARPFQALTSVALRAMAPSLMDNLRITLGWCWTYLIIAEIVAASNGLGFVIWTARRYMATDQVMAGVLVIGLIGLLSDQALRALHRFMFRYL